MMTPLEIYENHAVDSPAIDEWIEQHGGDIDAVRAFGPIAEMKGRFVPAKLSRIYEYQFIPDAKGTQRAIVMPVMEDGTMVDIAAWRLSKAKLDVWGTVTGAGRFLNRDAIYRPHVEPLFVCAEWWQWILRDCNAVMPLRVAAIPELTQAGHVAVNNSSHALQLLYEAYLWPIKGGPDSHEWSVTREFGRKRIWIDDAA